MALRRARVLGLASVLAASLTLAGGALAATGDLSFADCFDDEDTSLEGATCANTPGLGGAVSVAVSADGKSLYAASLNDGAVASFTRDPNTGALSFSQCIEDEDSDSEGTTCANTPGLGGASSVAVTADGKSLYAGSVFGTVVNFTRDPNTGALTFSQCFDDEDIDAEGASCTDVPGLAETRSVAASADGDSVYAASQTDDAVVHFSRDSSTGALSFAECFDDEDSNLEGTACANGPGLDGARSVAASADGKSVFVASIDDSAVVNFAKNPTTGALSVEECYEDDEFGSEGTACADAPGLTGAASVAPSPDGESLYVASASEDAVVSFTRNTTSGALSFTECLEDEDSDNEGTACANAPGLDGAHSLAASADGKSLYAASLFESAIVTFARNPTTGALSFAQCFDDEDSNLEGTACNNTPGLEGAASVSPSADGKSVYAAAVMDFTVVRFNREPEPPPPDSDGDGTPDASDSCPGQPGPASNGGCPLPPPDGGGGGGGGDTADTSPPDTTITGGPKAKTKKKSATFLFTSSEAGSTFECKLDAGSFENCSSPKAYKVKPGKHSFQVRAKDTAGNVDSTPATQSWTVKKKKKRK